MKGDSISDWKGMSDMLILYLMLFGRAMCQILYMGSRQTSHVIKLRKVVKDTCKVTQFRKPTIVL